VPAFTSTFIITFLPPAQDSDCNRDPVFCSKPASGR
jgi:hypothetical protein